jgi:hypothetical protein
MVNPCELLAPAALKVKPSVFIQQLHHCMDQLQPTPEGRHSSPATFIHRGLKDSTHVFLWQDTICRALDPPYSGPHKVIAAPTKHLRLLCAVGRSLCQQTESSLHTYWNGSSTPSLLTLAAHRPNPTALQSQQSRH